MDPLWNRRSSRRPPKIIVPTSNATTTNGGGDEDDKRLKVSTRAAAVRHKRQWTVLVVTVFCGSVGWFIAFPSSPHHQQQQQQQQPPPRAFSSLLETPRRLFFTRGGAMFHQPPPFPRLIHLNLPVNNVHVKGADSRVVFFVDQNQNRTEQLIRNVIPMSPQKKQQQLANSEDYEEGEADPLETKQCQAQYAWQLDSKPSCNLVHEQLLEHDSSAWKLLDSGYWRDVWVVPDRDRNHSRLVLKTLRYEHDVQARNFDRNRRDSVAMEHLTGSPWVLDIYSACGNAGFYEFAGQGSIGKKIWPGRSSMSKPDLHKPPMDFLRLALQATLGLAAVHNSDREGRPAIAHTDVTPYQFVLAQGRVKLNDFNRARFLLWDKKRNQVCPYEVGNNPGKNRAPEEYAYQPQTEKIDVYSLGNIFYMLLSRKWPFEGIENDDEVTEMVQKGKRPVLQEFLKNNTDPIVVTLRGAMDMCLIQDPEKRVSAREVERFLRERIKDIAPKKLAEWTNTNTL